MYNLYASFTCDTDTIIGTNDAIANHMSTFVMGENVHSVYFNLKKRKNKQIEKNEPQQKIRKKTKQNHKI